MTELKKLIRPDELAKTLGVAQVTVYSWVRRGVIPCYKLEGVVRFDTDEISEWLKERRVPARKIHGDLITAPRKEVTSKIVTAQKSNPDGGRPSGKGGKNASNIL